MRIATVQFTPTLGDVASSIAHAESVLYKDESRLRDLNLLVLPELAFTGYNFPTLAAIQPHLEPTASGPSTQWAVKTARRLDCAVAIGYPERTLDGQHVYNALVFVTASGAVVAHTRKSHLYYSDEIWAEEGPAGFFAGELPLGAGAVRRSATETQTGLKMIGGGRGNGEEEGGGGGRGGGVVKVAAGICMDINPYRFTAPWTAYEFTTHARTTKADLVVLSCAWLTHLGADDLAQMAMQPDLGTLGYWVERFSPLVGPVVGAGEDEEEEEDEEEDEDEDKEVLLVIANRTGDEGVAERVGEVRYAGSSCVLGLRKGARGGVRIWDILGRAEEDVLVVDTDEEPRYGLGTRNDLGVGVGDDDAADDGCERSHSGF